MTHSNESRGYFTRTKSQSSKGKKLVSVVVQSDIKKKLKGIDHKIEPDSTGTQIILTVNKSDVENVKKLVGLPNMVKVVSEIQYYFIEVHLHYQKLIHQLQLVLLLQLVKVYQRLTKDYVSSKLGKKKPTSKLKKSLAQSKKLLQDRTEEIEKIDEKIAGLVNKSEKTGVPYSILKKS